MEPCRTAIVTVCAFRRQITASPTMHTVSCASRSEGSTIARARHFVFPKVIAACHCMVCRFRISTAAVAALDSPLLTAGHSVSP
jgi:hypothetical protein